MPTRRYIRGARHFALVVSTFWLPQGLAVAGLSAAGFMAGCDRTVAASPTGPSQPSGRVLEPIVGLPCEGCEAVFQGLPETLSTSARIASANEPGEAMTIDGTVLDRRGRAVGGVIVYAYHTNAQGVYPTDEQLRGLAAFRHGRLRGWVQTDASGRYRFDTIRPAGYSNTDLPAHVHMHVIEVGRCTYYVDDIMFEDDPRLTAAKRQQLTSGRGGNGIVAPRRNAAGVWLVTRDIVLGQAVPGYPE